MKITFLLLATLPLTIGAAVATSSQREEPNTAMTATDFVMAAGGSDEFERQSGELAVQRAKDAKVRELAQRLVVDHSQTSKDLAAAAAQAGVPGPVPKLHPGQQRALQHLKDALPEDFDKLYLQQQAEVHQDAIGLLKTYSRVGDKAPLREAATKTRPLVQHHLERIYSLQWATG
jgi:putative membrane protein